MSFAKCYILIIITNQCKNYFNFACSFLSNRCIKKIKQNEIKGTWLNFLTHFIEKKLLFIYLFLLHIKNKISAIVSLFEKVQTSFYVWILAIESYLF